MKRKTVIHNASTAEIKFTEGLKLVSMAVSKRHHVFTKNVTPSKPKTTQKRGR